MKTLILASQSEARRRLLTKLLRASFPDLTLRIEPAWLDEQGLLEKNFGPPKKLAQTLDLKIARKMAATLARAKARACVIQQHPPVSNSNSKSKSISKPSRNLVKVLGSDQLLFLPHRAGPGGEILGKPGNAAGARKMLKKCSGRTAYLITSVALFTGSRSRVKTQTTTLVFSKLSAADIDRIIALDKPFECAGSFKFEEHGASLFRAVSTDDPTGIEGLPLMRVKEMISFS